MEKKEAQTYDLIILGAGCAGLTSGIYAGRARLNTLILENKMPGGQAAITNDIDNYPGVPDASGPELTENMLEQAKASGARFLTCSVLDVKLCGDIKRVETDAGSFTSTAVIVATGASPRKLGFEGEDKFFGRGISYCATCDGTLYRDKDIFVVGAGNSAAEEALFLTRFGKKVTILVRDSAFSCEKSIEQRVMDETKIEVRYNTELIRAFGEGRPKGIEMRNNKTGEITTYAVSDKDGYFGIFIFVGYKPETAMFKDEITLDERGNIKTTDKLETNIAGVYAAGDVRSKLLKQIVTAASDGAIAAAQAGEYIERRRQTQKQQA